MQSKWNFLQMITLDFGVWSFMFQIIIIIDDVTAAILNEKTRALSRPQFSSDFHEIWYVSSTVLQFTRFGIVIQLSTLSSLGQNDGWKKR